jgi:hypothetical protein
LQKKGLIPPTPLKKGGFKEFCKKSNEYPIKSDYPVEIFSLGKNLRRLLLIDSAKIRKNEGVKDYDHCSSRKSPMSML